MAIDFAASERSTIGVEWELQVVDAASGDLVPLGDDVLAAVPAEGDDGRTRLTAELLTNTVEVVTGVHRTVGEAVTDLERTIDRLRPVTDRLGAELVCSGTHPFARWQDQEVTQKERYITLLDRTGSYGRRLLIWGVHMHVGIDDPLKALPIVDTLLTWYPHLQALSASSPFLEGESTGYASNRAMLFQQLPTAGLPPELPDWASYERVVADLLKVGAIDEVDEVRWDVRPSPKWGTVETRICDGPPTTLEIGALTALVQCLVDEACETLSAGGSPLVLQPWFVRENKWRAARYGMDAVVIVDRDGTERRVEDEVRALVTRLEPVADRLGCAAELQDVLRIVDTGCSAQRQQLAAAEAGGDLRGVVKSLIREMREGFPA